MIASLPFLDRMDMAAQGSPEWLAARAGKVTASRIKDVLAKGRTKGAEAVSRKDYRMQIVCETLTGRPQESTFTNDAMRWGTEMEPLARSAYEIEMGVEIFHAGLVTHPTIARAAASPDGFYTKDDGWGLVEIKCPKTSTHLEYCVAGPKVPEEYISQMDWQMACTGAEFVDFVSFDPRLPMDMQLFSVRLLRSEERIDTLESEVKAFLDEVDATIQKLRGAA